MTIFVDKGEQLEQLLAKAESAGLDTPEGQIFMNAVQRKAARASIDLAMLRKNKDAKDKEGPKGTTVISRSYEMGTKGDRGSGAYTNLFWAIADVNDVKVIMNDREVTAYGVESDIDYVYTLYKVVVVQMIEARARYIDTDEWREDGVNIHAARRSFCQGYIERIKRRLWNAQQEAEAEAREQYGRQATDIVLADKKQQVRKMYYADAGKLKMRNGNLGGGSVRARTSGRAHANQARINSYDEVGGSQPLER